MSRVTLLCCNPPTSTFIHAIPVPGRAGEVTQGLEVQCGDRGAVRCELGLSEERDKEGKRGATGAVSVHSVRCKAVGGGGYATTDDVLAVDRLGCRAPYASVQAVVAGWVCRRAK